MKVEKVEIELEQTKSGRPALWEHGGGMTNTGSAQVVAGPNGEALSPLFIRRAGHLACGEHALFAVRPGYHIVRADRADDSWLVYRIERIVERDGKLVALCEVVAEHELGETIGELYGELPRAVKAAREKACCYHCREPHYVRRE